MANTIAKNIVINNVVYTDEAEAQAALNAITSGDVTIVATNGDLTLDSNFSTTGTVSITAGGSDADTQLKAGDKISSTITIGSGFTGALKLTAGTASEDKTGKMVYTDAETAPFRIIVDGATTTSAGALLDYNYGYMEFKNGANSEFKSDTHVRGTLLVTGEGTVLNGAFLSSYAADLGETYTTTASTTVRDGATLFCYTQKANASTVYQIGHSSKAYRKGELNIIGGTVKCDTDIKVNAGGTVNLSNSTIDGKTYYGNIIFTNRDPHTATLATTNAATGAVKISIKSADYAGLTEGYKIIDVQSDAALDLSKVAITVDGAAYTLGTTFGGSYSIKQVDNDLVLYYDDPYMLASQSFKTDTALSGTEKAYYRNPDDNNSGFKSMYSVGEGATLTIDKGVTVSLERDASGTKSIILVGECNYFADYAMGAGTGDLVVNGTLDVGQLNAMADGTITVNGELNITTACIEKGALIYNTGSTGAINCLNIFNNANATVTVNGLAAITLAGEPAHALKDNGATDIASRFVVNVTDADLAAMTGDTHTILNVRDSSVSIADKFTVKVNGAAYTLGEQFTTASGDTYVINMGDAGGDSTANDLILTFIPPPPIKVTNPDSSTQTFDSLLTANGFAQDGAVVEFVTSSFTDATVVAANNSLVLDKDITFKGKTTATFGITGSGYLMFGNTTTSKAINVTVAEGSDITFDGCATGVNLRYGVDTGGNKIASTLTIDNARMATLSGITSNGLVTVKGAGVKGTYGIGVAADDTFNAKYLVANIATGNLMSVKDRFDRYADDIVLNLTDYAYLVATNGITIGSEDGTITSIVSVENSKIELIGSANNSTCAFSFTAAHGNKLQISGDSEVLVKEFNFAKKGIITIDGVDAYVRAAKITVADGASATLNVTLTTEQLAAQSLELGVNTAIFEISENGDNLLETTVMLDGAAYTLGNEIVDDAGNKYVIKMGDANGDSVENDLVMTLTEKAPEPVIPEEPGEGGEGGEGSEGGMEIAAQNPPVFINPKYSEKTTGKKVNGVELEYGVNAFSSIEDAKAALGADAAVSMVVNKSAKFDSESDLSGISEIAGNSPVEKATVKSTPKKSLTLNGTTAAATDFRQFSKVKVLNGANIGGDIINEKYTVKFKGTKDANGEWLDGVATTTNAAVGTLKVTDSTIANAFGFKSVKLTNSQAGILGVNPVAKEVATIEGGAVASTEIVKEKRIGTVTAKDSIVDSVMDYKTLKLQGESAVASIENVQNVSISGKADVQINDLTDTANLNNKFTVGSKAIVDLGIGNFGAGNDKMTIGSKATVYADSLDFGEGKDSLKISGTLVLENGMLEGIEKISGRGEIATTAAYADALDERYDDVFGGEILDLGNTVANFRGTKNELADNTEKKALKWDTAEGELGGWLGIGDDVDCIDSVDFVKITASKDGTLEISSAAWNGSSDIVTLDGVSLDITGGSASFGITAGEDYLLKIERKDNNSMSYDIKLA